MGTTYFLYLAQLVLLLVSLHGRSMCCSCQKMKDYRTVIRWEFWKCLSCNHWLGYHFCDGKVNQIWKLCWPVCRRSRGNIVKIVLRFDDCVVHLFSLGFAIRDPQYMCLAFQSPAATNLSPNEWPKRVVNFFSEIVSTVMALEVYRGTL